MKQFLLSCTVLALLASPAVAATTPAPAAEPAHHGVFEDADANHDGVVTKQEWMAYSTKKESDYFDSIDTNHDGKLTQDEIKAAREAAYAKRQARYQSHRKGNESGSDTSAAAGAGSQ